MEFSNLLFYKQKQQQQQQKKNVGYAIIHITLI